MSDVQVMPNDSSFAVSVLGIFIVVGLVFFGIFAYTNGWFQLRTTESSPTINITVPEPTPSVTPTPTTTSSSSYYQTGY